MTDSNIEAPYGYKKDGTPYQRRPKGSLSNSFKPQSDSKPKAKSSNPTGKDYTETVTGLFQMVAFPLSFVSPPDAWAVSTHAPGIAVALNDLAQEQPEVAAMLDKLMQVGPYGALISACIPLACQIGANHKVLPPGFLGTKAPERIMLELQLQARAMQDQMEAEEAEMEAEMRAMQEENEPLESEKS